MCRLTLAVDEYRQVAANADCIHVVEKEEAIAAQQILNIVLRGDEQDVDPGIVHQPIKQAMVEWYRMPEFPRRA
jgi:hypothetical protein